MRRKTTLHKPSRQAFRIQGTEEGLPVDWADKLRPAETLGRPDEKTVIAMDNAMLNASTLLKHSLDLGQMPTIASFMGYPALQDISQNGLVRACIETVADDMTREFGTAKFEGETDDGEKIRQLNKHLRSHEIQKLLHKVSEFVGYFGGCLVFIDTGVDDAQLQLPLNISSKSEELSEGKTLRFQIIDPINVFAGDYNSINPLKADFYKPRYWWVMGKKVHASRLIRIVANEVPQLYKPAYNFFGIAQAQILWDYILHFNQCRTATAEMITKYSMTVVKTNMHDVLFQSGGTQQLDKRMQLMARYRNNNTVVAIDKEDEDIVNVSAPMSGMTDVGRQALEFLASINRTPAVKLLGISPSGFNATGESDIRNYYDFIKSQREKLFNDAMRVILACIQLNAFGELDNSITFEWDELGKEDEGAIAQVQNTKAQMVTSYLDRNVISQEEARQFVANDPDSGLNFIDPDDVPENEEDPEGEDPMQAMMGQQEEDNEETFQPQQLGAVQGSEERAGDGRREVDYRPSEREGAQRLSS